MGKIKVSSCETDGMVIEGLHVIEPTVFNDERGYFMETYNQNDFKEAGLNMVFVQDRAYSAAFISRSSSRRASSSVRYVEQFSM